MSKLFTPVFYACTFVVCLVLMNGKINNSIVIHSLQNNTADMDSSSRNIMSSHIDMYKFMSIRQINGNGIDERKKFRWLYKSFEINLYNILKKVFHLNNAGKYLVLFHYTIIMFLSFILSMRIFNIVRKLQHKSAQTKQVKIINALIFFSIYQFVLLLTSLDEWFTFIELFALLLAIYSSINKNILLFILAVIIGVSNRESGMVLGLIYPLLHYKKMDILLIILLVTLPFIFFTAINFDIISEFHKLILYSSVDNEFRVSLLQPSSLLYVTVGEIVSYFLTYSSFLYPLIYMLIKLPKSYMMNWIRYVSVIYILIILVGSYIGNFILLLLLLPFYMLVFSAYEYK